MWIIARDGFVSLVEHSTDPTIIRARARRREHLTDTFDLMDADVIDLGPNAPDYRWHANIPRLNVAQAMYDAVMDVDYASHVKEEVAGKDNVMYSAMLGCWRELRELQEPPARVRLQPEATLDDVGDIADQIHDLADRMRGAGWEATPYPAFHTPLPIMLWKADVGECAICGHALNTDDPYVMLPADPAFRCPEEPAHAECAEHEDWSVER